MTNCEACNGTGRIIQGHQIHVCGICGGRGEISRINKGVYSPTITFKRMEEKRSKDVRRNRL